MPSSSISSARAVDFAFFAFGVVAAVVTASVTVSASLLLLVLVFVVLRAGRSGNLIGVDVLLFEVLFVVPPLPLAIDVFRVDVAAPVSNGDA